MRHLLLVSVCLGLADLAPAQLPLEDFDGGTWPPAGWIVLDNIGNGQSWNLSSAFSHGNTAGTGECAAIDSDDYGAVPIDGELITPPFDVPDASYSLKFDHHFREYFSGGAEIGDVDICVDFGPWTNLVSFATEAAGRVGLPLDSYAGSTDCQLRFHYYQANFDWYWHVDNVVVDDSPLLSERYFLVLGLWDLSDLGQWILALDPPGKGSVTCHAPPPTGNSNEKWAKHIAAEIDKVNGYSCIAEEIWDPGWKIKVTNQAGNPFFLWVGPGGSCPNADPNELELVDDTEARPLAAGVTIIELGPAVGVRFCFGDIGSGTPCPCANDNDGSVPESGCANGVFASGAQLNGSGTASLSADTLVLATTGLEPSNAGLYFQADNDLSPGNVWGDGLMCTGGQLKRLGVRFADGSGYSDTSAWSTPISVRAGNIMAGDTKRYQCWYRNPLYPPCGTGVNDFNASNGLEVVWAP